MPAFGGSVEEHTEVVSHLPPQLDGNSGLPEVLKLALKQGER